MGASRDSGGRGSRLPALAVVFVAAAGAGAVACRPVDGNLNPSTVSSTTDQRGTAELERHGVRVRWLSCGGSYADRATGGGSSAKDVRVDCRGRTTDGKDIVLTGTVYGVVSGKCVRGSFTARTDGAPLFRAGVLGNCAAPDATTPPPPRQSDVRQPSAKPRPVETRTVTETVTAPPPDPGDPASPATPGQAAAR
ncbi:hypothetical protein [Streptomyces sp. NPDC088785]|uniref:hypothetical protein n=1 Tax=Streptomyces sp. NPDC088785 TaxID=3365897 RepID=UPI00382BF003